MAEYDYTFGTQENSETKSAASVFNTVVYLAVLVLVAVTAFLVGVMFERRSSTANSAELATLWEVWDIIERDFYGELPPVDERKYGAIQGLVASLNDPFTSFAPPEVASLQRQQIEGHFGGIGVVIRANDEGQVEVVSVLPGNPADEAGILAGDIFMSVDDQSVVGFSPDQLGNVVRGEIGTEVELTMFRPDPGETYTVKVMRAIIETPTVFSENLDGIGYLRLSTFNGVATSQMEVHMNALLEEDIHALVLDLRANGGGLLDQAVSIADLFLDEGVVLTQRSSDGSEEVFYSEDGQLAHDLPLVVLTDGGTASAAEVVAGALQDRGRAVLIGSETFGKGVVQLVYNLTDGSQLRVTSSAWYTPNDQAIHEKGLMPDMPVIFGFDEDGNDLVVQAALDYLNEITSPEEETEATEGE